MPAEVNGKVWNLKAALARFPDGVVPADDPILAYYRWFWSGGDGWPNYVGAIADEYRKHVKTPDFWSFWDPSVRCPPRWNSGGAVDYLNQWIYAVPEPMNVAGPLEEMFAMAADSSSAEIVVYNRRWQKTDYVFAINDKRTFGDYVGPWGMTMEKGLPFAGTVTRADPTRRTPTASPAATRPRA